MVKLYVFAVRMPSGVDVLQIPSPPLSSPKRRTTHTFTGKTLLLSCLHSHHEYILFPHATFTRHIIHTVIRPPSGPTSVADLSLLFLVPD